MLGNTSYYVIRKQKTFGIFPTTASNLVLGQQISMELTPNIVERQLHTGNIFQTPCNNIYQSSEVSVKFDGAFSVDYYPFFQSWLGNTMAAGATVNVNPTGSISLTIIQLDSQNPTKCRYATGCTVKSINLTGQNNDYIKMSVQLVGKELSEWTTRPTISGSYPSGPTCHNTTGFSLVITNYGAASITNMNMTFDTQFAPVEVRYGSGGNTIDNNTYTKKMITLTSEFLMDPTSTIPYNATVGGTTTQLQIDLGSTLIGFPSYRTKVSLPDPGNGLWKYSIQEKAVYAGSGATLPSISINY